MPKDNILTYQQAHSPDLATMDALKLEGRQPADGQPIAALFKYLRDPDGHDGVSGLDPYQHR